MAVLLVGSFSVVNLRINCLNLRQVWRRFWRRHKCRCDWNQEDRRLFCCTHVGSLIGSTSTNGNYFRNCVHFLGQQFCFLSTFFGETLCFFIQNCPFVKTLPNFFSFMKACRSDLASICRNNKNPQIFVDTTLDGFRRSTCHSFVAPLDTKQIKKQLETRGHVCELIKYLRLHKQ